MSNLGRLGSMDKVLLDQILADLADLLSQKDVMDYVWIGKGGKYEYRIVMIAYERKPDGKELQS